MTYGRGGARGRHGMGPVAGPSAAPVVAVASGATVAGVRGGRFCGLGASGGPDGPPSGWSTGEGNRSAAPSVMSETLGALIERTASAATTAATIRGGSRRGRRFAELGPGAAVCFPWATLDNPERIAIGAGTLVAPRCALAVGMSRGQEMLSPVVLRIGRRCVIGRGSSLVAHLGICIGDDVMMGPDVFVTDQNHDHVDIDRPIGAQVRAERPVEVGAGSWIGAGAALLPGARLGRHVTVAAGAVVTGDVPARCVVAGVPARIIRHHDGCGWSAGPPPGSGDNAGSATGGLAGPSAGG